MPICSQQYSIAGASRSAWRGGPVSAWPPSSTRPSMPSSDASTTPTRRVAVSMPSSSISAAPDRASACSTLATGVPRQPGPWNDSSSTRSVSAAPGSIRTTRWSAGTRLRDEIAPLHDRDAVVVEQLVEAEVVEILDAVEAVHVDVREREPARRTPARS